MDIKLINIAVERNAEKRVPHVGVLMYYRYFTLLHIGQACMFVGAPEEQRGGINYNVLIENMRRFV